jgi:hypothetical protein
MAYISYPEAVSLVLQYIGGTKVKTVVNVTIDGAAAAIKKTGAGDLSSIATNLAGGAISLDGLPLSVDSVLGPISQNVSDIMGNLSSSLNLDNMLTDINPELFQNPLSSTFSACQSGIESISSNLTSAIGDMDIINQIATNSGVDPAEVTAALNSIKDKVTAYVTTVTNLQGFTDALHGLPAVGENNGFSFVDVANYASSTSTDSVATMNDVLSSVGSTASPLQSFGIHDLCGTVTKGVCAGLDTKVSDFNSFINELSPTTTITLAEITDAHSTLDTGMSTAHTEVESNKSNYSYIQAQSTLIDSYTQTGSDLSSMQALGDQSLLEAYTASLKDPLTAQKLAAVTNYQNSATTTLA